MNPTPTLSNIESPKNFSGDLSTSRFSEIPDLVIEFATKNEKQLEATRYWNDSITEEIVFGGAKGGAKSYLGAALIFLDALQYPGTHYFIARKELTDLRKNTTATIYEVFEKSFKIKVEHYMSYNGQDNCFILKNGSKVFFISCDERPGDPLFERFGSMQMTRGWIEEAGEVAESAKANLWLSIGRWKNEEYNLKKKLLITCNPKKNWIKRDYVDPAKRGDLIPTRKFVSALSTDNPYLPKDYVDSLRNEKDNQRRERLFAGNWDYEDDAGSLFSHSDITDMFEMEIEDKNGKYMTVDVARQGNDRTVFYFWNGFDLYKKEIFEKQATDVTAIKLKEFAKDHKVPYSHIIVDEDGIGGAVVDACRGVQGFINNSSPLPNENPKYDYLKKTNFSNLKTQCAYLMAERVKNHEVSISVKGDTGFLEKITDELQTYKLKNPDDDMAKIALEGKDEQKKVLGRSPDLSDAFIFRGYFALKKSFRATTETDLNMGMYEEMAWQSDYDPFEVV